MFFNSDEDELKKQYRKKGYHDVHVDTPFLSDETIVTYRDRWGVKHKDSVKRKDDLGWIDDLEILDEIFRDK